MRVHKKANKGLCLVGDVYQRTLGTFVNTVGRLAPKRFLLGKDQYKAQIANLKLEQLWTMVIDPAGREGFHLKPIDPATGPIWEGWPLKIAEAIRQHRATMPLLVPQDVPPGPAMDNQYRTVTDFTPEDMARLDREAQEHPDYPTALNKLNALCKGLMEFTAADPAALDRDRQRHAAYADLYAGWAREDAQAASTQPLTPVGAGQTLYQAIDAYVAYCEATGSGGQKEPEDALAIKNATPDIMLEQFNYDAVQRVGDYWRSRPAARRHGANGKKIAVRTVINRLKATRRFIKWLHRTDAWKWKKPDEFEEALKASEKKLRTEDETLAGQAGPETWTVEELTTLYKYATDFERVVLLFGINLGFAQSEVVSFRMADIDLQNQPPRIKRVRRKTGKYFEAALWPQTIQAIDWLTPHRAKGAADSPWVLLTEAGKRPGEQHITNAWNRLMVRVTKDHPALRRLPYKFLRKTAYQLVKEASGSEEIAGTFEARGRLSTDEHASVYGRRLFDRVLQANMDVHKTLAPVFAAAPDAFAGPRKKGGSNISRKTIERIQALWREGVRPTEIMRVTGMSRQTVYRHRVAAEGAGKGEGIGLPAVPPE